MDFPMKRIFLIACAAFALTGCTTIGSLFAGAEKEPSPIQMANAYVPVIRPVAVTCGLPITFGTATDDGPLETVSATAEP